MARPRAFGVFDVHVSQSGALGLHISRIRGVLGSACGVARFLGMGRVAW